MPNEDHVDEEITINGDFKIAGENKVISTEYESTISCAIDPNDKQVLPAREDPESNNYTQTEELLEYIKESI